MSPGLRSRPSLSDLSYEAVSPGLRSRPSSIHQSIRISSGVAGITVPAFVERRNCSGSSPTRYSAGVAGITVPAFVERVRRSWRPDVLIKLGVSPGLRSRPSLSGLR